MNQWMKLSELSEPGDFMLIHGVPALVAHITKDGTELYQELCVAKFDMNLGFFVADNKINHGESGGEVYFYLIPEIPGLPLKERL